MAEVTVLSYCVAIMMTIFIMVMMMATTIDQTDSANIIFAQAAGLYALTQCLFWLVLFLPIALR